MLCCSGTPISRGDLGTSSAADEVISSRKVCARHWLRRDHGRNGLRSLPIPHSARLRIMTHYYRSSSSVKCQRVLDETQRLHHGATGTASQAVVSLIRPLVMFFKGGVRPFSLQLNGRCGFTGIVRHRASIQQAHVRTPGSNALPASIESANGAAPPACS